MIEIIEKAKMQHALTKQEIIALLEVPAIDEELAAAADAVRQKYVGDEVHLRGLIEFSNVCGRTCRYCGLRGANKNLKRYRMEPETILDLARKAAGYGYKTLVLQSGEDAYYTAPKMEHIIREIKKLDLALTLSIGEKTTEEYRAYKRAGADRYLLRIETTNSELYKNMHPGMSLENRLRCLNDLKLLGYEVGTGCLVGLPGQTLAMLADDILFFKAIDADMIGIGPFIPNQDTPLAGEAGGTFELARRVMAIIRLVLPDINIPATTAMETLNKNGRIIGLQSGANVVMPNVTEGEYRKLYALYPGKICMNDTPAHCRRCITGKIQGIGRQIASSQGNRKKFAKE
ncbi:MAG: [FeFe] hydrogenase H-cluster radical SAM maturase HydE [Pelosinus sp.]|nr:[FeFe] hydrogenase H-cluster radical SAM maturase HydE [Pelosinus sp.]